MFSIAKLIRKFQNEAIDSYQVRTRMKLVDQILEEEVVEQDEEASDISLNEEDSFDSSLYF